MTLFPFPFAFQRVYLFKLLGAPYWKKKKEEEEEEEKKKKKKKNCYIEYITAKASKRLYCFNVAVC